jgi:hypothetical protein
MSNWWDAIALREGLRSIERKVEDLTRERDQARGLACEYASRLARIAELMREFRPLSQPLRGALDIASGAAVQVPLRVLVEWALRQQGWERKNDELLGDRWYAPGGAGWLRFWDAIDYVIEREEAAPAAEAST